MSFDLLVPRARPKSAEALLGRELPSTLGNHVRSAPHFQPDEGLVEAINVALSVGAPLLLTGEPGTGKTQLAWYLAWYFRLGSDPPADDGRPGWAQAVHPLYVRSTTTARDLLYDFDAVRYFREAQAGGTGTTRAACVDPGPLWKAYEAGGRAVVLIDEVDKAPRDFPNDLLNVLDQNTFRVPERDEADKRYTVDLDGKNPPIVVITSNSERRLPEPFLRRCIFYRLKLDEGLVKKAVDARVEAGDYSNLAEATIERAQKQFWAIRGLNGIRKKPATGELLLWLGALNAMGGASAEALDKAKALKELPALSVLVKDTDDHKLL